VILEMASLMVVVVVVADVQVGVVGCLFS